MTTLTASTKLEIQHIQKVTHRARVSLYVMTVAVVIIVILAGVLGADENPPDPIYYNVGTLSLFFVASALCILCLAMLICIISKNFGKDLRTEKH